MMLIEYEMPVNKVASKVRAAADSIWRIFNHWVEIRVKNDRLAEVQNVGVDDKSEIITTEKPKRQQLSGYFFLAY